MYRLLLPSLVAVLALPLATRAETHPIPLEAVVQATVHTSQIAASSSTGAKTP